MSLPLNRRGQKTRYGLVGETCRVCGEPIFPPRDLCPNLKLVETEAIRPSPKPEAPTFGRKEG